MGFPIRKSPDRSSFAAPRSLSQLITSFIGSWCQGIPLALFLAWPIKAFALQVLTIRKVHFLWFSISRIMQAHMFEVYIAKIVFLPNFLNNKFPFMLPSHNCIIITMFSFQGASLNLFYKKLNEASISWCFSQSLVVESTGIEPVTSCLQGRRSPSWANPP